MKILKKFMRDKNGAVTMEYSMIGVLVSVMLISGATIIGNKIAAFLTAITYGLS